LREDELAAVQRREEARRRLLDACRRCRELGTDDPDHFVEDFLTTFLKGGVR
jgi:hypothetical protein